MGWFGQWWSQSDHYDQLSAHLETRGLGAITRVTISLIAGVLAVVALGTVFTSTGPQNAAGLACALVSCAGAAIGAVVWAMRWPSQSTSIRFVLLSSACISLIALAQRDPSVAMLTCTAFATLAIHIALFHRAWLMVCNFVVASVIGAIEGVRIARAGDVVLALCCYALLLILNFAVPFGVQVVVHVLGVDAVHAERDQLTGLLTRRAFHRRAKALLELGAGDQQTYVAVSVIDLDRFKQLNDSYGHSTGDDALVAVARALRVTTDDDAVICRSGGEEFVIAEICRPDEVSNRAQQLCEEIAALPFTITSSIGTAGVYPADRAGRRGDLLIELIAAADAAMYAAKRRGGNQVGHYTWPLPAPLANCDGDEPGYHGGFSA